MVQLTKINHGEELNKSVKIGKMYPNVSNSFKPYNGNTISNIGQSVMIFTGTNSVSSPGDVLLIEKRKKLRDEIAKKYDININNGKYFYTLFKQPIYYYNQGDFNQEVCKNPVDGKSHTIASSGCGITVMSMLVSSFLQRNIEPTEIGEVAYSTGSFTGDGQGTHIEKIPDTLKEYGLSASLIENNSSGYQKVKEALRSNNSLVVVNVGPGNFTKSGHYMLLADMNDENQVFVLDPNCNPERHPERGNTNRYYDFDYIVNQVQTSNDTPFIIVSE